MSGGIENGSREGVNQPDNREDEGGVIPESQVEPTARNSSVPLAAQASTSSQNQQPPAAQPSAIPVTNANTM